MFVPDSSLLQGMSYEQASCMGMPHLGAVYIGSGDKYKLTEGIHCVNCRIHLATNCHHEPQKGIGGRKQLILYGQVLRPALIALCGSGTTGCHGLRHSGKLHLQWKWDCDDYEEAFWNGTFFMDMFKPHDPRFFDYGKWYANGKPIGGIQ